MQKNSNGRRLYRSGKEASDARYKRFKNLLSRHESCRGECTFTFTRSCNELIECPCFPYGLSEEIVVDHCELFVVCSCENQYTLYERMWCSSGQSFDDAVRMNLF